MMLTMKSLDTLLEPCWNRSHCSLPWIC